MYISIFFHKVDCKWDEWEPFGECTPSCGAGFKTAKRSKLQEAKNGGKECLGKDVKRLSCFSRQCDGNRICLQYILYTMNRLNIYYKTYTNYFITMIDISSGLRTLIMERLDDL